tara:strand:- start:2318 stop:3757 length:1440 start_codon:yes stop_codon:yes gene_type:complete
MTTKDEALIGHLLRRAGFGAGKMDIDRFVKLGYEQTVDWLLDFNEEDDVNDALVRRYHPDKSVTHDNAGAGGYWLYRLVTAKNPLREKIGLFWHTIFATGYSKVTNGKPLTDQVKMFRDHGTEKLDQLLLKLSQDPAMIIWLDNVDNHNGAINENYGRELLELFSMGVGNYTEEDIKECSRAFTGWTVANSDYIKQLAVRNSIWPYGKLAWRYEFDANDHDSGAKTFLGETGNFNGQDIIEIICKQPATARFIARHLYHFFVSDEPPVPQWPYIPPQDPDAIEQLEKVYFDSGYDLRAVLRALFLSDFFMSEGAYFKKIKSPAELVVGLLRLTEEFDGPMFEFSDRNSQITFMGQQLMNPPSVEGWHQGVEWIETGSLTERVNFSSQILGDISKPGIHKVVNKVIQNCGEKYSSTDFVDYCLMEIGALEASERIREILVDFVKDSGLEEINMSEDRDLAEHKIADLLRVLGSMPEFQKC